MQKGLLMPTLVQRIMELMKSSPGLSDREITDTLFGHNANQQPVNQACRNLASQALLIRRKRSDGRIGNFPAEHGGPQLSPAIAHGHTPTPGDSAEQRQAEGHLIGLLAKKLGITLSKNRIDLPGGGWLEVDGASDSPPIICEAWAHVGSAKGGQKHKLMTDAFKLVFLGQLLPPKTRKILVLGDSDAIQHLRGRSWMAQALRANNVEIEVVKLPDDVRERLRRAQRRQFR